MFVNVSCGVDDGAGKGMSLVVWTMVWVFRSMLSSLVARESLEWQGRSIGVVHGVAWLGLFGVACNVVVSHTFVFTGYGSHLSLAVPHKLTSLPNTW